MSENTRSRKYLLTINNPKEHGLAHDRINDIMLSLKWTYYCLCDEIGEKGTYHTHLFFYCENAVSFEKIKKIFPTAHIETAHGSASENRDYIRKEGKYLNSDKKETNIPETFEEYGEIPKDKNEKNKSISEDVLEMLKNGSTPMEVVYKYPSYGTRLVQLNYLNQSILTEKYKTENRNVEVTYIWGDTGTGKTSYVLNKYGNANVYKVTNYEHPFDNYSTEKVLLLDEFRSQIPISDMLQYLDRYPCMLPARYANKCACYEEVIIISNVPIDEQYQNIQLYEPKTYNAFIRRFDKILYFKKNEEDIFSPIITEEIKEQYFIKEE